MENIWGRQASPKPKTQRRHKRRHLSMLDDGEYRPPSEPDNDDMDDSLLFGPPRKRAKLKLRSGTSLGKDQNSSGTESDSTSSPETAVKPDFRLTFQQAPPAFPFLNHYFAVKCYLVDADNAIKHCSDIPIIISVLYEDGTPTPRNVHELKGKAVLQTEPGFNIGSKGFEIRITELSLQHENRRFRLKISCGKNTQFGEVEPAVSEPFFCIRHRLVVLNSPVSEYYKDMGGKSNLLHCTVALRGHQNEHVSRPLRLRAKLVYESNVMVKNQNVLQMHSPCELNQNGVGKLLFRIVEVSKNHQKQRFKVLLEPDTDVDPTAGDVASSYTTPIKVFSKASRRTIMRNNQHSLMGLGAANGPQAFAPALPSSPLNFDMGVAVKLELEHDQPMDAIMNWCSYVSHLISVMEWQVTGFEVGVGGKPDQTRPILKCPGCWVYKDLLHFKGHLEGCMVKKALDQWHAVIKKHINDVRTTGAFHVQVKPGHSGHTKQPKIEHPSSLAQVHQMPNSMMGFAGPQSTAASPVLARNFHGPRMVQVQSRNPPKLGMNGVSPRPRVASPMVARMGGDQAAGIPMPPHIKPGVTGHNWAQLPGLPGTGLPKLNPMHNPIGHNQTQPLGPKSEPAIGSIVPEAKFLGLGGLEPPQMKASVTDDKETLEKLRAEAAKASSAGDAQPKGLDLIPPVPGVSGESAGPAVKTQKVQVVAEAPGGKPNQTVGNSKISHFHLTTDGMSMAPYRNDPSRFARLADQQ